MGARGEDLGQLCRPELGRGSPEQTSEARGMTRFDEESTPCVGDELKASESRELVMVINCPCSPAMGWEDRLIPPSSAKLPGSHTRCDDRGGRLLTVYWVDVEGNVSADSRSSWGTLLMGTDVTNAEQDSGEIKPRGGWMLDSNISVRSPEVRVEKLREGSNGGSESWFSRSRRFIGRNGLGGADTP